MFIIAGFIMPRMIDQRLGQELLGVWDFAWSLVSYFGLAPAAFVAKCLEEGLSWNTFITTGT